MTISEVIETLEEIRLKYGDIVVMAWPYDGQVYLSEITQISFNNSRSDITPCVCLETG